MPIIDQALEKLHALAKEAVREQNENQNQIVYISMSADNALAIAEELKAHRAAAKPPAPKFRVGDWIHDGKSVGIVMRGAPDEDGSVFITFIDDGVGDRDGQRQESSLRPATPEEIAAARGE